VLIFVCDIRYESDAVLFAHGTLIVPAPFVEKACLYSNVFESVKKQFYVWA
jgi:hypothetical protein